MIQTVIIGSGYYVPEKVVKNEDFLSYTFYNEDGSLFDKDNDETIVKFEQITEISERRYLEDDLVNSDMAAFASQKALDVAGIDRELLDYIIVAHNYGDVRADTLQVDIMPSISAKVKHKLGIKNNKCKPYDMIFGCPGWVEGLILADQLIKSGVAKHILVVGSETLSRVVDPHDRNVMIFADGAGAVVVKGIASDVPCGIMKYDSISETQEEIDYIYNGKSFNPNYTKSNINIHMLGRKVYEYAIRKVPALIKDVIDQAGFDIKDIDKVLLHQANAKMDHAMVERLFKLYGIKDIPNVDPMTIQKFGNSSVATIPVMYDLLLNDKIDGHQVKKGDLLLFGSVGAGMTINALLYKIPE